MIVKMGDFGNEYAAKLHILLPLIVGIVIVLPVFGYFYNRLMDRLRGKEHTSLYVAGGVLITIAAGALISWKSALLFLALFTLDGVFMVAGEFRRTERKAQRSKTRRARLPYAANAIIDDIKMSANQMHRTLGNVSDPQYTFKMQRDLTTVLLKIEELKDIQEN